ncbi:MAG TPA: methyltransferase domain-containing protein [Phycisphaerales bacterium]|nr:methyltransferase domain-containing protein [Phycisphaerales bacterium]HIN83918.1 methyltransferase domain-containing protein [Phycisphaerales bacterium]
MYTDKTTYRTSHAEDGYGKHYQKTYTSGYYATLWDKIEKPLILDIFSRLKSEGATTCLDFACGTGRITKVAEEIFNEVTGVDISGDMLDLAKCQIPNATFIEQDITKELLTGKYDVISSFRFFLNAENKLRESSLESLHNLLDENGTLVINVHVNKYSPLGRVYRLRNKLYGKTIANTLGYDEFSDCLNKAGFSVNETIWYGFYPRTGWAFGSIASMFLNPFETFCKRTKLFPKSWAQNFIVLCNKS